MGDSKQNIRYDHVYAIVRIDEGRIGTAGAFNPNLLAITKILRSKETADREVERLTRLNSEKGCVYISMMTRLERED